MRNPVYAVFGVGGIIGKHVHEKLAEVIPEYRIFSFNHSHADINNKQQVKEILDFINPTVVINCAAVSNPEICEQAQSGAFATNSVGPRILAEQCNRIGAKLVHFSTASVFGGDRLQPYSERCKLSPVNIYGKSKMQGEREIQATTKDYLIIRPGWIFNSTGPNFITEWISQIDRNLNIHIYPDLHGSPTFIPDLVNSTKDLIDRDAKGVFHVANSQAATWECIAQAVLDLTHGGSRLVRTPAIQYNMLPSMPKYTVLSSKKLKSSIGISMRPWQYALKQCLFQMERYKP